MMERIAFFGASVTEQKDSYANHLMNRLGISSFGKFGYGSMHINEAGICFVDEVISYKPEICFLDWFSTGYLSCGKDLESYLDCIFYKLMSIGSRIIVLLFPIATMTEARFAFYEKVTSYCERYGVEVFNIYDKLNGRFSAEKLMRDNVHTTSFGADCYALEIMKLLETSQHNEYSVLPNKNKYLDVKKLDFDKKISKFIELFVGDELVGIHQEIGPFSGAVDIHKNGEVIQYNIWDVWCHYERNIIKLKLSSPGTYRIEVSQSKIDKTQCKKQVVWETENFLRFYSLFHIGELKVLGYE